MKLILHSVFVVAIASSLVCCGIHTHFNKDEVDFLNAIGSEDTIVFASSGGEKDTFLVSKPNFYYPEYMPI